MTLQPPPGAVREPKNNNNRYMNLKTAVSRRNFTGGPAFAAGCLSLRPDWPPAQSGPAGPALSGDGYIP